MDIQLFRTFLLVAKLNNITQAAEQLNFTQPTITAQIQTLEEHFGVALFERIGKKLFITAAGRELTLHAGKLLTAYQDMNTGMQRYSAAANPIKLGASTTAASYILSPILLGFQERCPAASILVDICANLPLTVKGLLDNTFDLAIVHDNINHNQILQFNLTKEKLVWVAKRDLFISHNCCHDISHYPFINFRPGCVYRSKYEEVVQEQDVHSLLEYSDAEAIKRAVLDGLGASILPQVLVEPYLEDGTLVELTGKPQLTFIMSVAFHKSKVLTAAIRSLLLLFAEHATIQSGLPDYLNTKP